MYFTILLWEVQCLLEYIGFLFIARLNLTWTYKIRFSFGTLKLNQIAMLSLVLQFLAQIWYVNFLSEHIIYFASLIDS